LISNESALGVALLGQVAGSSITVESDEPYEIEIEKVEVAK
jgi:transcription elongation GreA/GreB family factor